MCFATPNIATQYADWCIRYVQMEPTVDEGTTDVISTVKKSEYDEAFDSLAAFLFEQYKKKKQSELTREIEE